MKIWHRVRYLISRRRLDRELAEELRIHEEMVNEELHREGVWGPEAGYAARRTMGNVTLALEDSRAQWNFAWLESLLLDVRFSWRSFRRAPIFACSVIGTIGLALGLNTTLFTIFNAYVLRPFAVRDPYRLYQFAWDTKRDARYLFTAQELKDLRRQTNVFSDTFAFENFPYLARVEGQGLWGEAVSGNYFTMLGAGSALGRTILPDDDADTATQAVLVLSHSAWKDKFGANSEIVGKKVFLYGRPFEIVGVTRPEFGGLGDVPSDFWVPLSSYKVLVTAGLLARRTNSDEFGLIGRIKPGVPLEQARAALAVWSRQQTADRPDAEQAIGVSLWSRATSIRFNEDAIVFFSPLVVAFGLVLLIACANVSNMMLARAMSRQREIGIRLSLGAGRLRLLRQLLTESLLLALPAAVVGFFVAQASVRFGLRLMFTTVPPDYAKVLRVVPLEPDWRVFAFVLVAAGFSALLFGFVPAVQATRPGLMYAMRGDFSSDFRPARLRNGLVMGQVTVCVLLLICAGVLLRAATVLQRREIGLKVANVLYVQVKEKFRAAMAERLATEPGVETVAVAWRAPFFDGLGTIPVTPTGDTNRVQAGYTFVSPEYFEEFRIPLIRGRNFSFDEADAEAPVAIISEAAARRFWPNQDAIGRAIRIEPDSEDPRSSKLPRYHVIRVIGLAGNVTSGFAASDAPTSPCLYFPTSARFAGESSLLIRVKGDASAARRGLDISLEKSAPGAVDEIIPVQEAIAALTYPFRVAFWISSLLGGLALVLTVSGIYGVMSYLVTQRTREIGIRMALGATTADVTGIVLRQSMKMTVAGVVAGAFLALGASRLLASVLSAMIMLDTFDQLVYGGAIGLVLLASAAAAYFPSRRAAQVDPATTLRFE